jgi:hypothetical protein
MMDLKDLLPDDKFQLWCFPGFMVEQWFKHAGRVDVGRLAAYFRVNYFYERDTRAYSRFREETWLPSHQQYCVNSMAPCTCPPVPPAPVKPPVIEYTTKDGSCCTLWEVVKHPSAHPEFGNEEGRLTSLGK